MTHFQLDYDAVPFVYRVIFTTDIAHLKQNKMLLKLSFIFRNK